MSNPTIPYHPPLGLPVYTPSPRRVGVIIGATPGLFIDQVRVRWEDGSESEMLAHGLNDLDATIRAEEKRLIGFLRLRDRAERAGRISLPPYIPADRAGK